MIFSVQLTCPYISFPISLISTMVMCFLYICHRLILLFSSSFTKVSAK